jgi:hypothetical protein
MACPFAPLTAHQNCFGIWRMPSYGMWRRVDLVWNYVSEERRFTQYLHGATSQKTAFFIVTAMKISNLTCFGICLSEHFPLQRKY